MSGKRFHLYEIVINRQTLSFESRNGDFFAFSGRFMPKISIYDSATESSRELLFKMIREENYSETFSITLKGIDGSFAELECLLVPYQDEKLVGVRMLRKDGAENNEESQLSYDRGNYFLYDSKAKSLFFFYFRANGTITIYRQQSSNVDNFCSHFTEDSHEKAKSLISQCFSGVRTMGEVLTGKKLGRKFLVTGMSVRAGDRIMTKGRFVSQNPEGMGDNIGYDELTGMFSKDTIIDYAKSLVNEKHQRMGLALVSIYELMDISEKYGAQAGDLVAKRCASCLISEVAGFGKVGRVNEDEFMIVFDEFDELDTLKIVLRGIKFMLHSLWSDDVDGFCVSASIGMALYPDDLDVPYNNFYMFAEGLLRRAKSKGSNCWIVYNPDVHGDVENVILWGEKQLGFSGFCCHNKDEFMMKLMDTILYGNGYLLENVLSSIIDFFEAERIIIYSLTEGKIRIQAGIELLSEEELKENENAMSEAEMRKDYANMYADSTMVVNDVETLKETAPLMYEKLKERKTRSVMQQKVIGGKGRKYVISFESINEQMIINDDNIHYYRMLANILKEIL